MMNSWPIGSRFTTTNRTVVCGCTRIRLGVKWLRWMRISTVTVPGPRTSGRGGDAPGVERGALERERRVDAQVAVDLTGLLELERARHVGVRLAAVPAIEGAGVHHHHREALGVGGLEPVLVLDPEHARHRGGIGPPEPEPPAILDGHRRSVGHARGADLGDLGG